MCLVDRRNMSKSLRGNRCWLAPHGFQKRNESPRGAFGSDEVAASKRNAGCLNKCHGGGEARIASCRIRGAEGCPMSAESSPRKVAFCRILHFA